MTSLGRIIALLGVGCGLAAAAPDRALSVREEPPALAAQWPAEKVILKDGRELSGLIESESDAWLNLVEIQRHRGRPMYLVVRPIERSAVARVARLEPKARDELRRRIEQFVQRTTIEAGRMEAVQLTESEKDGTRRRLYEGKWFSLESTTSEETTRRIIVRMEQVFTAYRQVLPPRTEPQKPVRLVVFGSLEDYQTFLQPMGLRITNRAVFLSGRNLVAAGSELGRYNAELASITARHRTLLAELRQLQEQLPRRLSEIGKQLQGQGASRSEVRDLLNREKRNAEEEIKRKESEVRRCERDNDRAFDKVAGQMLARLAHEGFHAYLENYVYPSGTHQVPQWLNEGLATMFEGGLLESGTFRLDAPNRAAFEHLHADLCGGWPLPLEDLLGADARAFLVAHDAAPGPSRRHYDYAWGLTYYLCFDRRVLGSDRLDQYVARRPESQPPVARFEKLTGQKLRDFEPAWREYIRSLR